jgi:hypothetical protein
MGKRFCLNYQLLEFTNEINGKDVKDILDLKNAAYLRIGFQISGLIIKFKTIII